MLGLLKLVRILRISKLISNLSVSEEVKALIKILQLLLYLFLYVHLVGCLWFYVIDWNDNWISPLDYIFATEFVFDDPGRDVVYQYAISFYYSTLMLGGNELGPTL